MLCSSGSKRQRAVQARCFAVLGAQGKEALRGSLGWPPRNSPHTVCSSTQGGKKIKKKERDEILSELMGKQQAQQAGTPASKAQGAVGAKVGGQGV